MWCRSRSINGRTRPDKAAATRPGCGALATHLNGPYRENGLVVQAAASDEREPLLALAFEAFPGFGGDPVVGAVFGADPGTDQTGTFGLESVTAKLSLTASGKVVFVGELGGETAFEAVFTRRTTR